MNQSIIKLAISAAIFSQSTCVQAALSPEKSVEQITIFGDAGRVNNIPGSGAVISQKTLDNYAVTDIQRALSSTAGVYFVEEDGYGLRPNIGMRGNSADRSEKVTIMEDGILAAPAPYASPAAYYFPTVGRMHSVEILKGGSSIMYGPRTSGGVINLVSTPIPDALYGGKFDAAIGSDGFAKVHSYFGSQQENVGALFEVFHYQSDGFKHLNSGQDTGFSKTDVMGKIDFFLDPAKKHQLEIKLKYSEESSDETYVGITRNDFAVTPFSRYAATQIDNMSTEHKAINVHYDYYIASNMDVSVIAYRNNFHRNWYKVSKVNGLSLGSGAEESASLFDSNARRGITQEDLDVQIKANNRTYFSQGLQTQFGYYIDNHDINVGLRIHNDEMDRFQWVDDYSLDSQLFLSAVSAGVPGTDSNRIESANAISAFVQDKFSYGKFALTAGVRYENVNLKREDWGKSDPLRRSVASNRYNEVSAFLPSVGATYQINDQWIVLSGVQKAFAPPSPGNSKAEKEDGWNYEFGTRFNYHSFSGELIGFVTKLDNLHGNCTASQSCSDDLIGLQFNAGKVDISGIEFVISHEAKLGELTIPSRFNYTLSNAEFKESFNSALDSWGSVQAGDDVPYLPEQMLQFETGVKGNDWHILVALKYTDEMRVIAGSGAITTDNGIKSRTVVDVSANYNIDNRQSVYAVIDNIFDREYVATKQHGGIQVGKPSSLQVGYRYQF